MDNFFKNLGGGGGKKGGGNKKGSTRNNAIANAFANAGKSMGGGGGGGGSTHGGGRLGGAKPGAVHFFVVESPGSLGIKVERTETGGAIIHHVVPGGTADALGLRRGDVVCVPGTSPSMQGDEEMKYEQFLALVGSDRRPLTVQVRRLPPSSKGGGNAGARQDGAGAAAGASRPKTASAAADARREAVIAAAEARDKAHKKRTKPIDRAAAAARARDARPATTAPAVGSTTDPSKTQSEEVRRAVAAAKESEAETARKLGYNPYETAKVSHGQAKTAVTAAAHGQIRADGDAAPAAPTSGGGSVGPTRAVAVPAPLSDLEAIDERFDEAYAVVTSSNDPHAAKSSISICRKLVVNATTKGQESGEGGEKFRRVRLSNPKIRAAVVDVRGALDLMLSCGFELVEQPGGGGGGGGGGEGETYLVYPVDRTPAEWIPHAVRRIERFEGGE